MVNCTEEKGLVKVDESIFTKIRRFFMLKFGGKRNEFVEIKSDELKDKQNNVEKCDIEKSENVDSIETLKETESNTEEVYEAKEEIERKLMNYYESIRKCI